MSEGLVLAGVTSRYRNGRGVEGLAFGVGAGEVVGVLGPNGCGKSTVLGVVASRLPLQAGRVTYKRYSLAERAQWRQLLGVVPEGTPHFSLLSGRENAQLLAACYGLPPDRARIRIEELFEALDLAAAADLPVAQYSYGMRRKLLLAEALMHQPPLLLLDEPSLGLDYRGLEALRELLETHRQAGGSVLVATNDVYEAEEVCQRVVLLREGRTLAVGTPGELLGRLGLQQRLTITLAHPPVGLSRLNLLPGVQQVTVNEGQLIVLADGREQVLPKLVDCLSQLAARIMNIQVEPPNLGDVWENLAREMGASEVG